MSRRPSPPASPAQGPAHRPGSRARLTGPAHRHRLHSAATSGRRRSARRTHSPIVRGLGAGSAGTTANRSRTALCSSTRRGTTPVPQPRATRVNSPSWPSGSQTTSGDVPRARNQRSAASADQAPVGEDERSVEPGVRTVPGGDQDQLGHRRRTADQRLGQPRRDAGHRRVDLPLVQPGQRGRRVTGAQIEPDLRVGAAERSVPAEPRRSPGGAARGAPRTPREVHALPLAVRRPRPLPGGSLEASEQAPPQTTSGR
mgnify:CR=1 FL=1